MNDILPNMTTEGPLVVALVYDGLCTFEFSIAAEIFDLARPEMGPSWYRFAACVTEPGPLRALGGLRIDADGGIELIDEADLIIIPGWKGVGVPVPADLCARLAAAHGRGARLASICSGAFVLAATGLLNGRRAATHWRYAEALQVAFPFVHVDSSVLYAEEDQVFTSAGSAAGIDLMLHIIRGEFGPDAANSVARRLVVAAHRSGGQTQFIERPVPANPNSRLGLLMDRVRAELQERWTLAEMARGAAMSERTLIRRFREATGQTPAQWLADVRIGEAKHLLEATALPVEDVARLCGFGSPNALRHHFGRSTNLAPAAYRNQFRHARPEHNGQKTRSL